MQVDRRARYERPCNYIFDQAVSFQDSCVGDSGSGLMRSRRDPSRGGAGRSELIGVVSFGPRLCGTEGVPGVYSRVESFLPWILDTVQQNN